jgi:hypothetical protein
VRISLTLLLLWAWLFVSHNPVRAILIETGPGKRVGGWLEDHKDPKKVAVRVKVPGGEDKVDVYDRAKIKIVHKVDLDRLKGFTRDKPRAYCDYADELAEQKADPEATEVALRLFVIAAYLDTPKLGRSCLEKMSALAADPADQRKYRAMAFLLDPDPALLKLEPGKAPSPQSKAAKDGLFYFRKALRQYRNGQFSEAQDNAKVAGADTYFNAAPGFMDQKSFIQACKDAIANKSLAEDNMDAVLRAEVWALDQMLPAEAAGKKGTSGGWARVLSNQLNPTPVLSLETISEFDPRTCVFKGGTWVAP